MFRSSPSHIQVDFMLIKFLSTKKPWMEWIHVSYVKFMKQTSLMLHNKTQAGELDPGGTVPCLHNYLESFGVDFLG